MMKKLLSLALLLATAGVVANSDTSAGSTQSVDNTVNSAHFDVSLTVQVVKNDGSVVSDSVKFTKSSMRHEIDGMIFEIATFPDNEAGFAMLDLKIYRGLDEQGKPATFCQGSGKVALNKEEVVIITERNNDDEVVQTMTLTFLVTE
ncbi:MAG: hypothetical protein ACHQVS_05245 [Candidatus Babeliales bacterium]